MRTALGFFLECRDKARDLRAAGDGSWTKWAAAANDWEAKVPDWQWESAGMKKPRTPEACGHFVPGETVRRNGTRLCVEFTSTSARCTLKSPDGRGALWLLSGGSPLAYGRCTPQRGCCPLDHQCPRQKATDAIAEAIRELDEIPSVSS
jgi:hypothetical protein